MLLLMNVLSKLINFQLKKFEQDRTLNGKNTFFNLLEYFDPITIAHKKVSNVN